jgi:hypothetical protein
MDNMQMIPASNPGAAAASGFGGRDAVICAPVAAEEAASEQPVTYAVIGSHYMSCG